MYEQILTDSYRVSIHTSAREVTKDALFGFEKVLSFNPHFRKGSDASAKSTASSAMEFQSTLPQGKWLGDLIGVVIATYVSIHTSAREVTAAKSTHADCCVFQSTLPQGKWQWSRKQREQLYGFNPHFRKGSDIVNASDADFNKLFQSTLPQGKWRSMRICYNGSTGVSIHTSAREVTGKTRVRIEMDDVSIHTSAREVTWTETM